MPAEVVLRSLNIDKTSAAKKSEVSGRSQEPLSEQGFERLNPKHEEDSKIIWS